MADVSFADNLYGCDELKHLGGCGLLGYASAASWYYERHGRECKPGHWRVGLCSSEFGEFGPLLSRHASAVMDDFGTLRLVGLQ